MIITLYKKCLLNDSYSEVFDCVNVYKDQKTAFEYYLSTLVQKDFDCGNVYVTNSGMLQFNLNDESTNIYDYNYIKIIDNNLPLNLRTRYAFIDDIVIINALAQVYYTEDIWANYSNRMDLRMGILTRSKLLNYPLKNDTNFNIPIYDLPLLYRTNNPPIVKETNNVIQHIHTYYVTLEIQFYKSDVEGKLTERQCRTVILSISGSDMQISTYSLDNVIQIITESSIKNCTFGTDNTWHYDITKVILIPFVFCQYLSKNKDYLVGKFGSVEMYSLPSYFNSNPLDSCYQFILSNNDFKNIGVGTLDMLYEIESNGTDIPIKVSITADKTAIHIYLIIQNKIIDITNSFTADIPISTDSFTTTHLKELNRNFQNKMIDFSQVREGMQMYTNAGILYSGLKNKDADLTIAGLQRSTSGILSMITNEERRNILNAKYYTSNNAVRKDVKNYLFNARSGIITLEIDPDNSEEVLEQLNQTGYIVEETIDFDILKQYKTSTIVKENVLKFDFVRMNGDFSQNIRRKLESILLNGFKIYYGI